MIAPTGLVALYPITPGGPPPAIVCLAFILLIAISAVAVAWRRQRPYLLTGWLWYLGMLFPVIGIIQISSDAAHADRYTYLPQIGLAIAATWAMADGSAGWKQRRVVLGGLTGAAVGALMVCGRLQTSHWRSGESLWTRALACTAGNSVAHVFLGAALARDGKSEDAIKHYRMALAIAPDNLAALNNLGSALAAEGAAQAHQDKINEAITCFQKALQVDPASKVSHYNLGVALAGEGELEEAIAQYRLALAIDPNFTDAHLSLGNALRKNGHIDDAIAQLRAVVKIQPDYAPAYSALGLIFFRRGDPPEATDPGGGRWRSSRSKPMS